MNSVSGPLKYLCPSDMRSLAQLAVQATTGVTDITEGVHQSVAYHYAREDALSWPDRLLGEDWLDEDWLDEDWLDVDGQGRNRFQRQDDHLRPRLGLKRFSSDIAGAVILLVQ